MSWENTCVRPGKVFSFLVCTRKVLLDTQAHRTHSGAKQNCKYRMVGTMVRSILWIEVNTQPVVCLVFWFYVCPYFLLYTPWYVQPWRHCHWYIPVMASCEERFFEPRQISSSWTQFVWLPPGSCRDHACFASVPPEEKGTPPSRVVTVKTHGPSATATLMTSR